jgi:ABC-2 type transport system permease protein
VTDDPGTGTPQPGEPQPAAPQPGEPQPAARPARGPLVDPSTPALAVGATGSIYDLGYRRYEGPRLGRPHAIRALLIHSLKVAYGLGRGGRAKIAPIILGGFAVIPAVIGVGIIALARQLGEGSRLVEEANPIRHDTYFSVILVPVSLFTAIQAPDIVGRDQRYSLLSLYFARALRRLDYTLARYLGMVIAMLIFLLLPQLIIFGGLVLSSNDIGKELGSELGLMPPTIAQALIASTLLAGLATVISAFTPRRLYATVGIVVLLAVTPIVTSLLVELGTADLARILVLASPSDVLDATNAFLFDRATSSDAVRIADLPGLAYVGAAAVITAVAVGIMVRRFERIAV